MTSRIALMLVIGCITAVYGMNCPGGDFTSTLSPSCPRFGLDSSLSYCCYNWRTQINYCCSQEEFFIETGMPILYIVVGVIVIISLFVCCLSCLCCTCCPWYKRRHRGTVYGQSPSPGIVQIIQPTASQPAQYSAVNTAYPNYSQGASTTPYNAQPPPYTENAHKQAPYNPNYPH